MYLNSSVNPSPVEFGKAADTMAVSEGRLSLNGVRGVYAVTAALLLSYLSSLLELRMNNREGAENYLSLWACVCSCGEASRPAVGVMNTRCMR